MPDDGPLPPGPGCTMPLDAPVILAFLAGITLGALVLWAALNAWAG